MGNSTSSVPNQKPVHLKDVVKKNDAAYILQTENIYVTRLYDYETGAEIPFSKVTLESLFDNESNYYHGTNGCAVMRTFLHGAKASTFELNRMGDGFYVADSIKLALYFGNTVFICKLKKGTTIQDIDYPTERKINDDDVIHLRSTYNRKEELEKNFNEEYPFFPYGEYCVKNLKKLVFEYVLETEKQEKPFTPPDYKYEIECLYNIKDEKANRKKMNFKDEDELSLNDPFMFFMPTTLDTILEMIITHQKENTEFTEYITSVNEFFIDAHSIDNCRYIAVVNINDGDNAIDHQEARRWFGCANRFIVKNLVLRIKPVYVLVRTKNYVFQNKYPFQKPFTLIKDDNRTADYLQFK